MRLKPLRQRKPDDEATLRDLDALSEGYRTARIAQTELFEILLPRLLKVLKILLRWNGDLLSGGLRGHDANTRHAITLLATPLLDPQCPWKIEYHLGKLAYNTKPEFLSALEEAGPATSGADLG